MTERWAIDSVYFTGELTKNPETMQNKELKMNQQNQMILIRLWYNSKTSTRKFNGRFCININSRSNVVRERILHFYVLEFV